MPSCFGRASHALRDGRIACASLAALLALLTLGAAPAGAWVFTSIVDFNLTETTATYGNYTISTGGDGSAAYRWVDDPNHTTIISGNNCSDLSLLGGPATIPAHDTTYHGLFGGYPAGTCFALRGRVAAGAGSMLNHDGTLRR